VGRDRFSGWGSLDVQQAAAALSSGDLPPPDRFEPNDKVSQARALGGSKPAVSATLDFWDDPTDVYRVKLGRGQRLQALVRARRADVGLTFLRQGTHAVAPRHPTMVAKTVRSGKKERLAFRTRQAGWYDIRLRVARPGGGRYTLHLSKSR
jgi:hypothetical protein